MNRRVVQTKTTVSKRDIVWKIAKKELDKINGFPKQTEIVVYVEGSPQMCNSFIIDTDDMDNLSSMVAHAKSQILKGFR